MQKTCEVMPGLFVVYDDEKWDAEGFMALAFASANPDLSVQIDLQVKDVLSQQQRSAENVITLRTK